MNTQIISVATQIFSILTLLVELSSVVLLVSFFLKNSVTKKVLRFFTRHALFIAFLVALVSTLGSLFYSEIAHFTPCKLCWYQRILMYPQAIILGIAYSKKDSHISSYSIVLSTLGVCIALYHYLLQIGAVREILPCTTVGYSVSCAEKFVMTYGYITIPMMSLSAFLCILFLMIALRKSKQKKS
jgi:disulfide bond formation protein DsbB